jgi:predicted phage tail protein
VNDETADRPAGQLKLLFRAEGDRLLAWTLIVAGAVLIVVAFVGVSGTPYVADQLSYIASGGIGGLFLLACGLTIMVSADHHDEWRKLDRIERALTGRNGTNTIWLDSQPRPAMAGGADEKPGTGPEWRHRVPARTLAMAVGVVAGAVLIVAGWIHSSGTANQGVAARGTTVSLAGLLVMVVAAAGVLAPSRQRLSAERARLLRGFLLAEAAAGFGPATGQRPGPASPETVFVGVGLTRYHLAGCPALNGLRTTAVPVQQLDPTLDGCELCGAAGH